MPPPALSASCKSTLAPTASASHPTSFMTTKTHPLLPPHTHLLGLASMSSLPLPLSAPQPQSVTGTSPLKLVHGSLSAIVCVDFSNSRPTTTVALAAGVSTLSVTSMSTPMIASIHKSQPAPKRAVFPFTLPKLPPLSQRQPHSKPDVEYQLYSKLHLPQLQSPEETWTPIERVDPRFELPIDVGVLSSCPSSFP